MKYIPDYNRIYLARNKSWLKSLWFGVVSLFWLPGDFVVAMLKPLTKMIGAVLGFALAFVLWGFARALIILCAIAGFVSVKDEVTTD